MLASRTKAVRLIRASLFRWSLTPSQLIQIKRTHKNEDEQHEENHAQQTMSSILFDSKFSDTDSGRVDRVKVKRRRLIRFPLGRRSPKSRLNIHCNCWSVVCCGMGSVVIAAYGTH